MMMMVMVMTMTMMINDGHDDESDHDVVMDADSSGHD